MEYIVYMFFDFNPDKNKSLQKDRDISFEEIIALLEDKKNIIDIIPNKNYPNQKVYVIWYKDYVYMVPFVENVKEGYIFLKTIFCDRKTKRKYGK